MSTIEVMTNADAEGKVHLDIPTGSPHTRFRILATLEVAGSQRALGRDEYHAFLDRIAGSITDPTFNRPPQPALPAMEAL